MASAKTTIDHETIKHWVEERGGCPARVKGTGSDEDPGILRIDYPGFSGVHTLEPIDWDTFFDAFEDNELAFLYHDQAQSRFSKLISRDRMGEDQRGEQATGHSAHKHGRAGPDAIEYLEAQHREVEALFQQIAEAESWQERSELFLELADKLAAHAKIEETIFYPAICDASTVDQLHEAVEEHLEVKRAIAELLDIDPTDRNYLRKIEALEQLVSHHVEDEEGRLFVAVREQELIDPEVLGRKLERRFEELIDSHPHRQVPAETDHAASLPC
jgi:hypothetical protein